MTVSYLYFYEKNISFLVTFCCSFLCNSCYLILCLTWSKCSHRIAPCSLRSFSTIFSSTGLQTWSWLDIGEHLSSGNSCYVFTSLLLKFLRSSLWVCDLNLVWQFWRLLSMSVMLVGTYHDVPNCTAFSDCSRDEEPTNSLVYLHCHNPWYSSWDFSLLATKGEYP